jgi:D-alanyl-D-alanine carboxypeptidase
MNDKTQKDFLEQHADVATGINLLDKWIAMTVHDQQQPGLAAGILYDGELIWSKGYGVADLEAKTSVTEDTRFRIASITKTFTATAILQLRDAGKLNLDDPISLHLPWFKLQYPGAQAITIRHVLTHTSGLPRDAPNPQWTESDFYDWDKLVETTKEREPVMPPVTEFKYSNLAYSLLGGVIEAVSGQPWAKVIQSQILDPLEMKETIVTAKGDEPGLAVGYKRFDDAYVREPAPPSDAKGFSPAFSMASSINDLAKYARFHLGKEETGVLSIHTLRDMHRAHWLHDDWTWGYGLGISVNKMDKWTYTGHGGGYPGYLTMFTICRKHKFSVIILTNALGSNPMQYVEKAYKLVLPAVIEATKEKAEPDPNWQQYVGSYVDDWSQREIVVREGQLQMITLSFIDMPPAILEPTDTPHVFKIKSPGESGETACFEFDDVGKIVKFWYNNEYSLPKD